MEMANAAQDGEKVPNVALSLLTRLRYVPYMTLRTALMVEYRQIALHPGLVPADYLEQLKANQAAAEQRYADLVGGVGPEEKARLQNILFRAEEDNEEVRCSQTVFEQKPIPSDSARSALTI